MKKYLPLSLPNFLVLFSCFSFTPTYASQTWNSFCSNIKMDSSHQTAGQLQAINYTVQPTKNEYIILNSKKLMVNQNRNNLSKDQLQRVTNITSTGLLTIFLKYPMNDCSKHYYVDTITPILSQMKPNEPITFTWKNITIKNLKVTYTANQLQLKIQNINNNTNISVSFSGLKEHSNKNKPNILFPTDGRLNFSTASSNYSLILAASSGNNENDYYNASLPLIINNLQISNPYTYITASGQATLDRELNLQAANGNITVSNIDTLIAKSNTTNINRLKTALILAKFAGRTVNNNTLAWDIHWQGNLFKVNNVPIPIW